MRIAIIGAGNVGSAIARAAHGTGHDVVVSDAADESHQLAESLGVPVAETNAEAVQGADAVVLAVPYGVLETVAEEIAPEASGKIVIDVTNPLREDYSGLATEGGPSGAERLQTRLPGAHVVKAFNTVFASNQDKGEVDEVQLDGFVAGDDPESKEKVMGLLADIGFRPIDTGPLLSARYLEAMGYLNIALNAANDWPWQTGWKLVGPTS